MIIFIIVIIYGAGSMESDEDFQTVGQVKQELLPAKLPEVV